MRGTATAKVMAVWILGAAQALAGQSREAGSAGPRPVLPRAQELALARSAAPTAVSGDATVLAWNGSDFEVAAEGSNGVTCYVGRSRVESLEPHCFDEEGARTILPIHLLETRMLHEGRSPAEIDAAVAEGLRSGALRLPIRPAMSYMMSAEQRLVSDDGRPVGAWESHLMIYYPYLTQQDLGLGAAPSTEAAVVVDPGTPFSNIMVVLKAHVPVTEVGASNR
jgi:hypothetical protein